MRFKAILAEEARKRYPLSILLMVVIPIQEFEVTHLVADGELIEFSLLWKLVWSYLLARALPLFLLGIWLYRKRELGLVIRK